MSARSRSLQTPPGSDADEDIAGARARAEPSSCRGEAQPAGEHELGDGMDVDPPAVGPSERARAGAIQAEQAEAQEPEPAARTMASIAEEFERIYARTRQNSSVGDRKRTLLAIWFAMPDAFSTLAELEAIHNAFAGPLDRAAHRYQAEEVRQQAASRVAAAAAAPPPRQEIPPALPMQKRPPNPFKRDSPAATSTSQSSSSSSGIALGPSLPVQPQASSSVRRTPAPAPSVKLSPTTVSAVAAESKSETRQPLVRSSPPSQPAPPTSPSRVPEPAGRQPTAARSTSKSGDIASQVESSSTEVIDLSSSSGSEDQPEAEPSAGGPRQSGRAGRPTARSAEADAAQEEEEDEEDSPYMPSSASKGKGKVTKKNKKRQMVESDDGVDADPRTVQGKPTSKSKKLKARKQPTTGTNVLPPKARKYCKNRIIYRKAPSWKAPPGADRTKPSRKISAREMSHWYHQPGLICWNCLTPWTIHTKWLYVALNTQGYSTWVRWFDFEGSDQPMCDPCRSKFYAATRREPSTGAGDHPAQGAPGRPLPLGLMGLNERRVEFGRPELWHDLIAIYRAWVAGGRRGHWDAGLVSAHALEVEMSNGVVFDRHGMRIGEEQGQEPEAEDDPFGGSELSDPPDVDDDVAEEQAEAKLEE